VLVTLLAACGRSGPAPDSGPQVSETIEDVDYYYACGNEVLELQDGRRFYPFVDQDEVDQDAYASGPTSGAPSATFVAAALLVLPPEPGDDTGTLTIYEDGVAQFVSDSGTEAWLREEEQAYNWDC